MFLRRKKTLHTRNCQSEGDYTESKRLAGPAHRWTNGRAGEEETGVNLTH